MRDKDYDPQEDELYPEEAYCTCFARDTRQDWEEDKIVRDPECPVHGRTDL